MRLRSPPGSYERAEAIVPPTMERRQHTLQIRLPHFKCEAYQAGLDVRFWHLVDI